MAIIQQSQPVLESPKLRVYALSHTIYLVKATKSAVFRKPDCSLAFVTISNTNPLYCSKLDEHHAIVLIPYQTYMNLMLDSDKVSSNRAPEPRRSGFPRHSIGISIIFHGLLLIALLFWYIPQRSKEQSQTTSASKPSVPNETEEFAERHSPNPTPGENTPANEIEASLSSAMKRTEGLSNERKFSELEKNLQRLESISSPDTLQDTTDKIANALGLSAGPSPSHQPVEGVFDTATAQIHDVTRVRGEDDKWVYQSILVDSAGRTQQVDLPETEGEVTYNTFQQLRKFPMAEGIYRQLVMPMLQKALAAADAVETQVRETQLKQNSADATVPNRELSLPQADVSPTVPE
jgi:hypothetical protein